MKCTVARRHGEVVQAGRSEKNNAVTGNSTRRLVLICFLKHCVTRGHGKQKSCIRRHGKERRR